jgi:phage recombination protein Bet
VSNEIVRIDSAQIASQTGYDRSQVDLVKTTIARDATDEELLFFLNVCQRSGLDPFAKQIYLIKRWDNKAGREIATPQTSIDGYRLIADRTDRYAPGREPTFTYADDSGIPHSATAYVKKLAGGIWHEVAATAFYAEYVQTTKKDGRPTQFWRDKPHLMLAKCAEALALRRAFPAELSGVYTREEMDQASNEQEPPRSLPTTTGNRRQKMIERIQAMRDDIAIAFPDEDLPDDVTLISMSTEGLEEIGVTMKEMLSQTEAEPIEA